MSTFRRAAATATRAQPPAPFRRCRRRRRWCRSMNANIAVRTSPLRWRTATYRMASPLTLDASDSGTGGHNVVWTAATGAHPVVVGSKQIKGWSQLAGSNNIWVAPRPNGHRASPAVRRPGSVQRAATGASPSAGTLAGWKDPSGAFPPDVEFIGRGGGWGYLDRRALPGGVGLRRNHQHGATVLGSTRRSAQQQAMSAPVASERRRARECVSAISTRPARWYLDVGNSSVLLHSSRQADAHQPGR